MFVDKYLDKFLSNPVWNSNDYSFVEVNRLLIESKIIINIQQESITADCRKTLLKLPWIRVTLFGNFCSPA